jgi:hypothetical protein
MNSNPLKPTSLAQAHAFFESLAISGEATAAQKRNAKHCFYAGAIAMCAIIDAITGMPAKEAQHHLDLLKDECSDWKNSRRPKKPNGG